MIYGFKLLTEKHLLPANGHANERERERERERQSINKLAKCRRYDDFVAITLAKDKVEIMYNKDHKCPIRVALPTMILILGDKEGVERN